MILVTLLGKASLWADPEGSFQVLSARLELCHPSPCCQHGPIPSGCGSGAVPQTFTPAHHQGGNTDITALRHTLTHTHTLTKIVAHIQFHIAPLHHCTTANGLFSRRPLPSNTHPPPLAPFLCFSSFSTLAKVARQQRKTSHTHTPHYASEGYPDVLVYIMECAGRREADSEPP